MAPTLVKMQSVFINKVKELVTQKFKFCQLTVEHSALKLFQTCMHFLPLWNMKEFTEEVNETSDFHFINKNTWKFK